MTDFSRVVLCFLFCLLVFAGGIAVGYFILPPRIAPSAPTATNNASGTDDAELLYQVKSTLASAYLEHGETKTDAQLNRMAARYVQDYGKHAPDVAKVVWTAIANLARNGDNEFSLGLQVGVTPVEQMNRDVKAGRLDLPQGVKVP